MTAIYVPGPFARLQVAGIWPGAGGKYPPVACRPLGYSWWIVHVLSIVDQTCVCLKIVEARVAIHQTRQTRIPTRWMQDAFEIVAACVTIHRWLADVTSSPQPMRLPYRNKIWISGQNDANREKTYAFLGEINHNGAVRKSGFAGMLLLILGSFLRTHGRRAVLVQLVQGFGFRV